MRDFLKFNARRSLSAFFQFHEPGYDTFRRNGDELKREIMKIYRLVEMLEENIKKFDELSQGY